jgi:hypothetical protein
VEFDASVPSEYRINVAVYGITSQDARHSETSGDIEARSGAEMPNQDDEEDYSFRVQKTHTGLHDLLDWYATQSQSFPVWGQHILTD